MDRNRAFQSSSSLPDPPARIHFVGIGGIGVSGLARMLLSRGHRISGSDLAESPILDELRAEGIVVQVGHAAGHVSGAELVVTTAAARDSNPELVAAREAGIPVVKRAAVLGMLSRAAVCLAVAGSHGKSTTSGMAAVALNQAGLDPSFAVGAVVPQLGTNARLGSGPHFVVEADEYDYSFLQLDPDVAVVTNIEHDHPDLFPAFDDVLSAFEQFARRIKPGGTLVLSADDPGCVRLARMLDGREGIRTVTFGTDAGDWRVFYRGAGAGEVQAPGERTFQLRLAVPGRHNLVNALAVLASFHSLGVEPESTIPGLERFTGVGRRFSVARDDQHLTVVDDYAHHPTEIVATIAAARERYPGRRMVAIFQPHTYSRTRALLEQFAAALDSADLVILADVYPARETDTLGVSSQSIAELMSSRPVTGGSLEQTVTIAHQQIREGDVVLIMGAGDIYTITQRLSSTKAVS